MKTSSLFSLVCLACPLAESREAILKREMPRVFEKMRAGNADASKLAISKIAAVQLVHGSDVACAKEPGACGSAGEQIQRIATKLGISPGSSGGGSKAAYDAALKTATSQRRIGTFHDASREGVAAGALKRAGVSYSAMALYKAADDVKKNDLGVPLFRERAAGVLVKSGSDTFCRAYIWSSSTRTTRAAGATEPSARTLSAPTKIVSWSPGASSRRRDKLRGSRCCH